MKRLIISTILLFVFKIAFAQSTDTVKVLFVGNSFTSVNNLPFVFEQLAIGANRPVVVASHMPGGISVGDTVQGTSAHMNNPLVYNLIRSNDWDFLVLQDNQGRFVYDYGLFPASSLVMEGHIKIRDSLLFYHPCAKMVWFAGWGPKAGYLPYASTGVELINRIYNNYKFLLDTAGQFIAPIGPAWERIIVNYPTINLWDADDVHPGLNGTFLTAAVIFSSVFKSSPIQSTYVPASMMSGEDTVLKNTGFQTVIDSLFFTGLDSITPEIVRIGNTLNVSGYLNCNWYLNNIFITATGGILNITQTGVYTAIVSDVNGCEFRTLEYLVSVINSIDESKDNTFQIVISPNPTTGKIILEASKSLNRIQVFNSIGSQEIEILYPNKIETIDLSHLPKGIYYLKLTDSVSQINGKKIIVE